MYSLTICLKLAVYPISVNYRKVLGRDFGNISYFAVQFAIYVTAYPSIKLAVAVIL